MDINELGADKDDALYWGLYWRACAARETHLMIGDLNDILPAFRAGIERLEAAVLDKESVGPSRDALENAWLHLRGIEGALRAAERVLAACRVLDTLEMAREAASCGEYQAAIRLVNGILPSARLASSRTRAVPWHWHCLKEAYRRLCDQGLVGALPG